MRVRLLGTVPGGTLHTDPDFADVAFDGTNYAVALGGEEVIESTIPGDDCDGVCEADYLHQEEVIAGTLAGAPKVLTNCTLNGSEDDAPRPAVAIAAGRTFFAGLHCGAPAGIAHAGHRRCADELRSGREPPLQGAGNWLDLRREGRDQGDRSRRRRLLHRPGRDPRRTPRTRCRSRSSCRPTARSSSPGGSSARRDERPGPGAHEVALQRAETLFAGDRLFFAYRAES